MSSSILNFDGVVPEWSKGADCKSAGVSLRMFKSFPRHHYFRFYAGVAQLVERHPSKVEVESSSLFARSIFSQEFCSHGSEVEYFLGKEGVPSSILGASSILGLVVSFFYCHLDRR